MSSHGECGVVLTPNAKNSVCYFTERNKRGILRKMLKRGTIVYRTTTSIVAGLQWG